MREGDLVRDARFEDDARGVVESASACVVVVRWRGGKYDLSRFEISAAQRWLRPVAPSLAEIFRKGDSGG